MGDNPFKEFVNSLESLPADDVWVMPECAECETGAGYMVLSSELDVAILAVKVAVKCVGCGSTTLFTIPQRLWDSSHLT